MKLVGYDGNITEKNLGEDTVQLKGVSWPKPSPSASHLQSVKHKPFLIIFQTEELVVSPHTENAKEAFNALETVRTLQQELL